MKLVTSKQMHTIDTLASARYHIPSLMLMEHAANGVYLKMCEYINKKQSILVVCGSGNNGGDGFALAKLLYTKGYQVALCFAGKEEKLTEDAKINYVICQKLGVPFLDTPQKCDVLVDCLFGTGLCRTVEGIYKKWIETINRYEDTYVISMDIPSGIDSDNGSVWGCAVKADKTYTMQCGKPGLYIYPGRLYANEVEVIDIFIPQPLVEECESATYLVQKEEMASWLPERSVHSNKGSYGKVLCVGGSTNMSGAITMAAKSALASGCGLLTCAVPESIKEVLQTTVLESMSIPLPQKDGFVSEEAEEMLAQETGRFTTFLLGCGIGRHEAVAKVLTPLLKSEKSLVIDADGLHAFKKQVYNRPHTILTPHLKEFADFLDKEVKEVVEHTLECVDIFCQKYPDITLVLKSETTIIAKGDVRYLNTYGNNGLAVGGSGDVLAGLITGLYAQNGEALQAAVLGVFLHAYSADLLLEEKSEYSIVPTDVIGQIEKTIKLLQEEGKHYD